MKTRYIALIGAGTDVPGDIEKQVLLNSDLEEGYAIEGIHVFLAPGSDRVGMQTGDGLVIGFLFDRNDRSSRVQSVPIGESDSIDRLLKDYWGGYVAVTRTEDQGTAVVLRDPSGTMPCFYIEFPWGLAVASDVDILFDAGLLHPEVNWDFIAKHLLAPNLASELTGLVSVKELLAGNSLSLAQETISVRQCWSPWDFVKLASGISSGALAERLRETVTGCVSAWAGCFDNILLGVSGGLDSSIIASVLAEREGVICYTIATSQAEGDERSYARTLTDAVGLPLVEAFYDLSDIDLLKTNAAHLPYPIGVAVAQSNLRVEREIAETHGTDVCFSGAGGDAIFCFSQSAAPLVDIVRTQGLGRQAFRTLSDICDLTDSSYWAVIEAALKRGKFQSPNYKWHQEKLFLNRFPSLSCLDVYWDHSWLDAPPNALPGKAAHVAKMLGNQMLPDFTPCNAQPRHLMVLNAQPILEICLGIPTWAWVSGGRNRAIARHAFSDGLPAAIVNRRTKGGPNAFLYELAEKNREKIREILLDGLLAQHDMIDGDAVKACLNPDRQLRQTEYMRLLELVEVEAWLRYWTSRRRPTT